MPAPSSGSLRLLLETRADSAVQSAPKLVGQSLVGRVAQERAAESQIPVVLLLEKLLHPGPGGRRPAPRRDPHPRARKACADGRSSPNTDARRTRARGLRVRRASIRAIAAASAESGRPPMPPEAIAEAQQVAQELRISSRSLPLQPPAHASAADGAPLATCAIRTAFCRQPGASSWILVPSGKLHGEVRTRRRMAGARHTDQPGPGRRLRLSECARKARPRLHPCC